MSNGTRVQTILVNPRSVKALFAFLVLALAGFGSANARADDSVVMAMNRPSTITALAQGGLFTSIVRAGRRLVAAGERGRILISDDDGTSWRQVETPTSVTLTQLRFATPRAGWAVGQMGVVLRTTDGGLTWIKQFDGLDAGRVALAAAKADLAVERGSDTATANLQAAQAMVASGPNVPFLAVLPLSTQNVLLGGAFGMAYVSHDGGSTWQSLTDMLPNPNGLHYYALIQTARGLLAAGEQGLLLRGSLGAPFTTVTTPFQGSFFGGLVAPDKSVLLFGLQGTILRSTDQGNTWLASSSPSSVGIDCGLVLRDGGLMLGDIAGNLLYSADGKTFVVKQTMDEPVVALGQAANGALITGGPLGLRRLFPPSPGGGA